MIILLLYCMELDFLTPKEFLKAQELLKATVEVLNYLTKLIFTKRNLLNIKIISRKVENTLQCSKEEP